MTTFIIMFVSNIVNSSTKPFYTYCKRLMGKKGLK